MELSVSLIQIVEYSDSNVGTTKPAGGGISTKPIGELARYLWEKAEVATTKFLMHGYLFGFQNLVPQWNHWQRLFPVSLKKELSGLMLKISK